MADEKVHIFISHISEEQVEAMRAKSYLEKVYRDRVEVFTATSWTSIAPGDDWFLKVQDAIEHADVMVVLCSADSVMRPWIQFETGAGWFAKRTKVIPICHKAMTPAALPEPIRRLQAVDINDTDEAAQLAKLAKAIRAVTDLPEPAHVDIEELAAAASDNPSQTLKGWVLRPGAHQGEELTATFKVGEVKAVDYKRAESAKLDPNDTIFVKLFLEPPTGQFVNAMASGQQASLFERLDGSSAVVQAKVAFVALHASDVYERSSPLIVVREARERVTG